MWCMGFYSLAETSMFWIKTTFQIHPLLHFPVVLLMAPLLQDSVSNMATAHGVEESRFDLETLSAVLWKDGVKHFFI